MVNTDGWSERKKTLHRYLKRAFDENRGAEAILLWQWRKALVGHESEIGVKTLKKFEQLNAGQPRDIRAFNLIEEKNGRNNYDTNAKPMGASETIASTPKDQQTTAPPSKLNLEFDEVRSAYQMACEAQEQSLPVLTMAKPVDYYVH